MNSESDWRRLDKQKQVEASEKTLFNELIGVHREGEFLAAANAANPFAAAQVNRSFCERHDGSFPA